MALANFTPSAYNTVSALPASARVVIPGSGLTTVRVANLGPTPAFVLLGDNTVVVTAQTGVCVLPNESLALAIGANTNIAMISQGGSQPAVLNLAAGA